MAASNHPRRSLFAVWQWPRWIWGIGVLLMLAAYPLSIGPVYWLLSREGIPQVAWLVVGSIYSPLGYICKRLPALNTVMEHYLTWWIPPP